MARDLTEALTALASNKRLMSSMQASRSFSSPDLLSLAQQLQDSGQWPAVQDMVQREEEEWADGHLDAEPHSAHANYGTVVGRPHVASVNDEGQTRKLCSCLSPKQASNASGRRRCTGKYTYFGVPPQAARLTQPTICSGLSKSLRARMAQRLCSLKMREC